MTRPLAEVEAEAALITKRRDVLNRIWAGGITADEERLEREKLDAIGAELDALEQKRAPAPVPPVLPDVGKLSREDAAKRAAEIRAAPEYFTGRKADGTRLGAAEHERLVREHSELLARAAESEG